VEKKKLKQKIIALFKEKERIEKEIASLQDELVNELCPKGKSSCEPAYCTFRYTNTCPFLIEWRRISKNS
jgi:hypothetical protein